MTKKLWQASLNQKKNSNLFAFENFISKKFNKKFNNDFQKILNWSIKNSSEFWNSFWDFTKINGKKGSKLNSEKNLVVSASSTEKTNEGLSIVAKGKFFNILFSPSNLLFA